MMHCRRCKFTLEQTEKDEQTICWPCLRELSGGAPRGRLNLSPVLVEREAVSTTEPTKRFRAELLWIPYQIGGIVLRQILVGDEELLVNRDGIPIELLSFELFPNFPRILWPTMEPGVPVSFELVGDGTPRSFGGVFLGEYE